MGKKKVLAMPISWAVLIVVCMGKGSSELEAANTFCAPDDSVCWAIHPYRSCLCADD